MDRDGALQCCVLCRSLAVLAVFPVQNDWFNTLRKHRGCKACVGWSAEQADSSCWGWGLWGCDELQEEALPVQSKHGNTPFYVD